MPKIKATKKPTNPEIHLALGDQNLNRYSEIIHRPIDKPNRSRPIPNLPPKNHLAKAYAITMKK